MKLALDPQMFYSSSSVYELPDIVASLGYDWMELSPKADFVPFFKYPRVDDAGVKRLKKLARDAGVGIASVLPVLRWSGPDEDQRQAAVRAWKRVIQIAVDLGVDVINSEFNGRPEAPETAEAQFMKSMDELLPIFEREGVQLIIEPHPDDFIEDGLEAVNMIRGLNRDWIGFLYCTPHAFHQGHDPATIIEAAGDKVRYVAPGGCLGSPDLERTALHLEPAGQSHPGAPAHGDGYAELRRLARLAIDTGVDGAFVEGRTPTEIEAELGGSDAGRAWLEDLERTKDPWFNMATGDGLYHFYVSWQDDPSIPYASMIGYVAALKAGQEVERPTEEIRRERDRLAEEYGALVPADAKAAFDDLLNLSRTVFPFVEEHKFLCDYWFLTRWWKKVREFGALLATHGFLEDEWDVFHLKRHEVAGALDELLLTWATGGAALGPTHWPPIVARRRELLRKLAGWTPPPAIGATPEAITDPAVIMLWGVTTQRVQEWARRRRAAPS